MNIQISHMDDNDYWDCMIVPEDKSWAILCSENNDAILFMDTHPGTGMVLGEPKILRFNKLPLELADAIKENAELNGER